MKSWFGASRRRNAAPALAVMVILSAVVVTGPLALSAKAANAHPACKVSQIRVRAGATLVDAHYDETTPTGVVHPFANEAVPVYFYNVGGVCHLLMGGPIFQAVRHTTDVKALPNDDLSMPGGADNEHRQLVEHHEQVEALLVVVKPSAALGAPCDPAATTGFLVGDYADPIGHSHFIKRNLHYVCFDFGAGSHVLNIGASWVPSR